MSSECILGESIPYLYKDLLLIRSVRKPEIEIESMSFTIGDYLIGVVADFILAEEIDNDEWFYTFKVKSRFSRDGKQLEQIPLNREANILSKVSSVFLHGDCFKPELLSALREATTCEMKFEIMAWCVEDYQSLLQERNMNSRIDIVLESVQALIAEGPLKSSAEIKTKLPPKIQEIVEKDFLRLKRLPESSTEHAMLFDWLHAVKELPWGENTVHSVNLTELKQRLDSSHYGLNEVKEYILHHFNIEQIKGSSSGGVLCFCGEPGTGKTTIAEQIALASNRPLIQIAVGGLYDETELRGSRRTFVASRPGRIISGIKQAQSFAPVIILDEIDKIGSGPDAALLELLDPAQNKNFIDRYFEFPIDLSQVLFICTANEEKDIKGPLRDRMEMISFPTYSVQERLIIVKDFLIPKILSDYKIKDYPIQLEAGLIEELVKEPAIRQIEKLLRKLYKKAAYEIAVNKQVCFEIAHQSKTKTINKIGF